MSVSKFRTRTRSAALNAAGLVVLSTGLAAGASAAEPLSNLPFNIAGGTPNLDLRLRYESVDQENLPDEADAITVRARLGYTTGKWNDIDGQIEFEGVHELEDHFNSTDNSTAVNRRTKYPIVADPEVDEINQAWIRWSGLPGTSLKLGRQRMVFDNHRILGNVGWRQDEQTYDAVSLNSTLIPRTVLDYGYLTSVNAFRFFDFDPTAAVQLDDKMDVKAHYLHAAVTAIDKKLIVTPYALLLDFDGIPAPALARQDSKTLGLRLTGALPMDKFTLSYALEYADQQDYKDAPRTVDADYTLAEAGLAYGPVKGMLSYEVLGGDGVYSFQTPLATLHAFQGWADLFLVTPATGLQDMYATLTATVARLAMTAVYHDYQSDQGSADFGTELDLMATYPVIDSLIVGAKYAAYNADEFPVAGAPARPFDTDKLWVWLEYKF